MLAIQPKSITVHKTDSILEILWKDEHVSRFPLFGLRKACPCVVCKGGHAQMSIPADPKVFFEKPTRIVHINQIVPMGNYAIQIHWSDGHNSGMYRWEVLREWCPCKECKPEFHTATN